MMRTYPGALIALVTVPFGAAVAQDPSGAFGAGGLGGYGVSAGNLGRPAAAWSMQNLPSFNPPGSLTPHELFHPSPSLSPQQMLNPSPSLFRPRSGDYTLGPGGRIERPDPARRWFNLPRESGVFAHQAITGRSRWLSYQPRLPSADELAHMPRAELGLLLLAGVESLQGELTRHENGSRWKDYFELDCLVDFGNNRAIASQHEETCNQLQQIYERFQTIAANETYHLVSRMEGFRLVSAALGEFLRRQEQRQGFGQT
jgi:hypothetical protein